MQLFKENIESLNTRYRSNLVNSITGIKPAHLIGTISKSKVSNLAIYSSIFHLGSDPALVGFITRPDTAKDTYQNILEIKQYTINHVHESFVEQAHYTSARLDRNQSEFAACKLTETYIEGFKAPFVKESNLKIGLNYVESVSIQVNNTVMVIGEICSITVPDHLVNKEGLVDLVSAQDVGVTGYNSYYSMDKLGEFPYVKADNLPDFK